MRVGPVWLEYGVNERSTVAQEQAGGGGLPSDELGRHWGIGECHEVTELEPERTPEVFLANLFIL